MAPYVWPSDEEQSYAGVKAVFLGHYFKWDPQHTFEIAKKFGFKSADEAKTGYYKFADIDDAFLITIHHWMKWYKFGFTRIWDNLSLEIRNKRMKREDAILKIKDMGEECQNLKFLYFVNMLIFLVPFFDIANSFRNKNIWEINKGKWYIKDFLIKDWKWIYEAELKIPRIFNVGKNNNISISDMGDIFLEPNEQITFVTENGDRHDFCRKNWGFYATPSINSRLINENF